LVERKNLRQKREIAEADAPTCNQPPTSEKTAFPMSVRSGGGGRGGKDKLADKKMRRANRDGSWYQLKTSQGFAAVRFGLPNDKPTPNVFVP
jgi:hypothetical protein